MEEGEFSTSFTESGTVTILLVLSGSDRPLIIADLKEYVPNYYALRKRIAKMEEEGLVHESLETRPRKSVYVSLTDKGKQVASLLGSVLRLIPSEEGREVSVSMKYAEPVMVMLHRNGKLTVNDILTVFPNYVSIVKKLLPAMERDGLITLKKDESSKYKPNTLELTSLGKMVAIGLNEVHSLVQKSF